MSSLEDKSTYVSYDFVDSDIINPTEYELNEKFGKKQLTKTKSLTTYSNWDKNRLDKTKPQATSLKQRKKTESKRRQNQQQLDAIRNSELRNSTQRRSSLINNVGKGVRRLSRGFSVPATFFKTRQNSKGELSASMPVQSNVADSRKHEKTVKSYETTLEKQTVPFCDKPKKSSPKPRSFSTATRFATLKNFRKKSLSKIASGWKSDNNDDDDVTSSNENILSSQNSNTAGILKIYVGSLSLGSNYKSILITSKTTSKNALRMILERYNIPPSNIDCYVLCEVTGKLLEESKPETGRQLSKSKSMDEILDMKSNSDQWFDDDFIEDYIRPLSDVEQPLILKSNWKTGIEESKRFEVRRRSKIFRTPNKKNISTVSLEREEKARATLNLRTFAFQPRKESDSDFDKITSFDACCSFDEFKASVGSPDIRRQRQIDNNQVKHDYLVASTVNYNKTPSLPGKNPVVLDERVTPDGSSDIQSSGDTTSPGSISLSSSPPYMLTLQGNEEVLIHFLNKPEVGIGSDESDFKITAPDMLGHHCVIHRELEVLFSDASNSDIHNHWSVAITPLTSAAKVWINGSRIHSKSSLKHGDLVSIGKHHLFMYKDPLHHGVPLNESAQLQSSVESNSSKEVDKTSGHTQESNSGSASTNSNPSSTTLHTIKSPLRYSLLHEDGVIDVIFSSFRDWESFSKDLPLSPAVLLSHCILYSFLNFNSLQKVRLLDKISHDLDEILKSAVENINQSETFLPTNNANVSSILADCHPVAFWMSNSIELFNFCKQDLSKIIRRRVKKERKRGFVDDKTLSEIEAFGLGDKFLNHLEKEIAFAFRNLLYHVKQILKRFLPAVLHSNPFREDKLRDNDVTRITDTLTHVIEMLSKYDIKQRITEQLVSYLLNFTNAFLFNTLMDKESAMRLYNWEAGVRIRGNLDQIEIWALENGYAAQSNALFSKISALANLLATPKDQLFKSTWVTLRGSFLPLTPSQLSRVLDDYYIPTNKMLPTWKSLNDKKSTTDDVNIKITDHPSPVLITATSSSIDPKTLPSDPFFKTVCNRIRNIRSSTKSENFSVSRKSTLREQPDGSENYQQEKLIPLSSNSMDSPKTSKQSTPKSSISSVRSNSSSKNRSQSQSEDCGSLQKPEKYLSANHKSATRDSTTSVSQSPRLSKSQSMLDRRNQAPRKVFLKSVNESHEKNRLQTFKPLLLRRSPTPNKQVKESLVLSSDVEVNFSPPLGDARETSKNINVVNVKICKEGLGLGFVDGMDTAAETEGIFIRFILPENTSKKDSEIHHHEYLRCLPLDGQLNIGDRILAANGNNFLKISYNEAINALLQANGDVRLLVKKADYKISTKILLPTKLKI